MTRFLIMSLLVLSSLTPAWGGQGWYLIEPDTHKDSDGDYSYSISMARWTQIQSFESGAACEKERTRQEKLLHKTLDKQSENALKRFQTANYRESIRIEKFTISETKAKEENSKAQLDANAPEADAETKALAEKLNADELARFTAENELEETNAKLINDLFDKTMDSIFRDGIKLSDRRCVVSDDPRLKP